MLIAAYVFIGQQSHMSDMPLLHVICTTAKGNWYCLSHRLIMTAGSSDNCLVNDLIDVYLLFWICIFFLLLWSCLRSYYKSFNASGVESAVQWNPRFAFGWKLHEDGQLLTGSTHMLHMFSSLAVTLYLCVRLIVRCANSTHGSHTHNTHLNLQLFLFFF